MAASSDLICRFQKIKPQLFCLGFACCWNAAKHRLEIWSQRKDGSRHGGLTDEAGERQRVKSFRRQNRRLLYCGNVIQLENSQPVNIKAFQKTTGDAMLKTKSTTETMGSSEISDQNDGLDGFNELEPTLPPRRKGSLRKAALEALRSTVNATKMRPSVSAAAPRLTILSALSLRFACARAWLNFAAKRAAAASCVNSLNSICCSLVRFAAPINRRLKLTASMLH